MPPGPAPMTPTRGLRFDNAGPVGEITLRECDGGHTWPCYISSLICKTVSRRWCSTAELGYEVTVVKDATASYSDEEMHAALEINIPNYATAILSADEILDAISTSTA